MVTGAQSEMEKKFRIYIGFLSPFLTQAATMAAQRPNDNNLYSHIEESRETKFLWQGPGTASLVAGSRGRAPGGRLLWNFITSRFC